MGIGALALVYSLLRSRLGLALTAIRDNETASVSLGIRIERVKFAVYVIVAGLTGMVGTLISLQKIRMSPDAAFSVNDWTAFVIFIVVIGGIGTIEGPIVGTLIYFLLREFLADQGSIYLMILGALAIVIMLLAPKGVWGFVREKFNISLFPDRLPRQHQGVIMAGKVIISVAITGGIHTPTMSPHLPVTPDEIATQSIDAAKAGAAIIHLHARDPKDRQAHAGSGGVHAVPAAHQAELRCGGQHHHGRWPEHDRGPAAGGTTCRQSPKCVRSTWAR